MSGESDHPVFIVDGMTPCIGLQVPATHLSFTDVTGADVTLLVHQALQALVRAFLYGIFLTFLTLRRRYRVQSCFSRVLRCVLARPHDRTLATHASHQLFCSGSTGSKDMSAAWGVPFLGRIPLDPSITEAGEAGVGLPLTALARPAVMDIVERIVAQCCSVCT